jgi:hypothetical protein
MDNDQDPRLADAREYDLEHKEEYLKSLDAQDLLDKVRKNEKGFRKPGKKAIDAARETLHEYRRVKAERFLKEHTERVKHYGVEIKAFFDEDFFRKTGMIKPSLTIADFKPVNDIPEMKPWSEALEDNLAARMNCTHELNEDETVCDRCGLNPENWGDKSEGVADDYLNRQREKIEAQKAKELEEAKEKESEEKE